MINEKTLDRIADFIEAGVIYNVDWKDLKESINRQLSAGYKAVTAEPYLALPRDDSTGERRGVPREVSLELYYAQGPQIHANMQNKIAKLERTFGNHWMVKAAREYADAVLPIIADANKIKATITKARKPRETDRETPERTIENTGTCAVCGRNVKREKGGQMWAHGYTLRWGFQQGNCAGVGYQPIEISPEGAVNYLGRLRDALEQAEADVVRLEQTPSAERTREQRDALGNAKATVRYAPHDIKRFEDTVANWKATDLPDAK